LSQPAVLSEARLRLQQLNDLPPLSASALRLVQAVEEPEIEVRAIARIIEQDPPLLARLVGLANAAYFGLPTPVVSAEEAIFKVLGLNTAKNLALAIVLSGVFDTRRVPGFHTDAYWLSAVTVAFLAQRLAPHVQAGPVVGPAEAYLCGLLHNLGVLALAHVFPDAMAGVFAARLGPEQRLADVERALLGTDHHDAGGWVARRWHLPPPVVAAIEHHESVDYAGPHQATVRLVGWCAQVARDPDGVAQAPAVRLGVTAAALQVALDALAREREALATMAQQLAG
jgi:HD-like signal output (HDOD) protein